MSDTPASDRRRRLSDPAVATTVISAVLLALFILAAAVGGFILSPAIGFLAFAGACLVAELVLLVK